MDRTSGNGEKKLQAALYIRVSTKDQEDGTSMETQEDRLKEFCTRERIEIVEVYRDGGHSGATMERPDLQRMLADARAKRFDVVLVYKLDRLSRNLKDAINLVLGDLEENGIKFKSITESFDTSEHSGRVMLSTLSGFADYERNQIKERTTRGRDKLARDGKVTGSMPPYGFKIVGEKRDKTLQIEEQEATVILRMVELVVREGKGYAQVAKALEKEGYKTRMRKLFAPWGIERTLKHPAIKGEWVRNRINSIKTPGGKSLRTPGAKATYKRQSHPKDKWFTTKVPAIIDADTFDSVQRALREHGRNPRRAVRRFLLTGRLTCECGARGGVVYSDSKTKYSYYGCYAKANRKRLWTPRYHELGATCKLKRIRVDEADQRVWEKIEELVTRPEVLWDAVFGEDENKEADLRRIKDIIRQRELDLKSLERREEALLGLAENGMMVEKVRARLKVIEADKENALVVIEEQERVLSALQSRQELRGEVATSVFKLKGRIHDLDMAEKLELLDILVPGGRHHVLLKFDGGIVINGVLDFDREFSQKTNQCSINSYHDS